MAQELAGCDGKTVQMVDYLTACKSLRTKISKARGIST